MWLATETAIKAIGILTLALWLSASVGVMDRAIASNAPFGKSLKNLLLQPLANFLRSLFKEDATPEYAIKKMYNAGSFAAIAGLLLALGVIPFGGEIEIAGHIIKLQVAGLDAGVLFALALAPMAYYGPLLAGHGSDSKLALVGSVSALGRLIGYKIALFTSISGIIAVFGTFRLEEIAAAQVGSLMEWGIIYQPFGFLIFAAALVLGLKSMPMQSGGDWRKVHDWRTEYTGVRLSMLSAPGSLGLVIWSMLAVTFYFGAYNLPWLEWSKLAEIVGNGVLLGILQILTFTIKTAICCWALLYARRRIHNLTDESLMSLGWKLLLPLAFVNLVATGLIVLGFNS